LTPARARIMRSLRGLSSGGGVDCRWAVSSESGIGRERGSSPVLAAADYPILRTASCNGTQRGARRCVFCGTGREMISVGATGTIGEMKRKRSGEIESTECRDAHRVRYDKPDEIPSEGRQGMGRDRVPVEGRRRL
jgi:hypothetical protein